MRPTIWKIKSKKTGKIFYKLSMATLQIKNFAKVKGGKRLPPGFFVQDEKTNHPYVRVTDMESDRFNTTNIKYLPEVAYEKIKRYTISNDDVYISIAGTIGLVGRVPDHLSGANLTENAAKITELNKSLIDRDYLIYFLRSRQGQFEIQARIGGSTQPKLALNKIETIELPIRTIDDQVRVATVLSTYDKLIENNEKRIQVLQEMGELFYNEWFVKFKFPGHERIKMVNSRSEFGTIPEGWKIKTFGEVANYIRGRSYSSEQISDTSGEYYLVNLKSFSRGGGFRFDGDKYYTGPINDNQLLVNGDIVVAVTDMTTDRAVIARPARIPKINFPKITLSADVVKIVAESLPLSFVYQALMDYRFTQATKNKANGANVLHLKPDAIQEYRLVIPDQNVLGKFDKFAKNILSQVDNLIIANQTLTKMRDLLIPQLITGKRQLKNYEN